MRLVWIEPYLIPTGELQRQIQCFTPGQFLFSGLVGGRAAMQLKLQRYVVRMESVLMETNSGSYR
jgi:hypothetical protein